MRTPSQYSVPSTILLDINVASLIVKLCAQTIKVTYCRKLLSNVSALMLARLTLLLHILLYIPFGVFVHIPRPQPDTLAGLE